MPCMDDTAPANSCLAKRRVPLISPQCSLGAFLLGCEPAVSPAGTRLIWCPWRWGGPVPPAESGPFTSLDWGPDSLRACLQPNQDLAVNSRVTVISMSRMKRPSLGNQARPPGFPLGMVGPDASRITWQALTAATLNLTLLSSITDAPRRGLLGEGRGNAEPFRQELHQG